MAEQTNSADTVPYSDTWELGDKLDFVAFHARTQSLVLASIEHQLSVLNAKLDEVGQKVTNVDAFCKEVNAALTDMRNKPNPMMKMLGMMPPPPPGRLIS